MKRLIILFLVLIGAAFRGRRPGTDLGFSQPNPGFTQRLQMARV
jgi:hypothetical protein